MRYFSWIPGLGPARTSGVLSAMWHEMLEGGEERASPIRAPETRT